MKSLTRGIVIPPAMKELARQVANTAVHAAVFGYVTKKVADYVDSKKPRKRIDTDE